MEEAKEVLCYSKRPAPLYNLNYLERITDGQEEYLRKLVLEMITETDLNLSLLRQQIIRKDIALIKNTIQEIKPQVYNFRIANIADDIKKIEQFKESMGWEDFLLIILKFVTFVEIVLVNMRKDLAL